MRTFAYRSGYSPVGVVVLALVVGGVGSAGCSKPSSEQIQVWKGTQKGPERLEKALADRSLDPKLRAEAAAALVDIGRSDETDAIFTRMAPQDRLEVLRPAVSVFAAGMKDPSSAKALGSRDGLFSLRAYAPADEQKRIDDVLLPALEADLRAGHLRNGRHSAEKILTSIGAPAGAMLVRLLGEPIESYSVVAEFLGKVGDDQAREAGGRALVARAAKEKRPPDALFRALGVVGGPSAVKLLQEKVATGGREQAPVAVRALALRRDASVLPFALETAANPRADKLVRDEMFGVIEAIGGLEAQRGLLGIISSDKEELVRYRAFESALEVAKADAIVPALEAFPAGVAYKKVDVDDLLVKLIEKLGPSARPALVKALESRSPLARMTAVMALEQMGRAPDASALEKAASDTTMLRGFPPGETIGKEASRVAEVVKKRA